MLYSVQGTTFKLKGQTGKSYQVWRKKGANKVFTIRDYLRLAGTTYVEPR